MENFIGGGDQVFSKFKYKNQIFTVGDDIQIYDESNEPLVGRIEKVIVFNGSSKYPHWPTIEVKWYYRKKDIIKSLKTIPKFNSDYLSEYELFESNHKDVIYIETVIGKCCVLSIDDYDKLEEVNNSTYFSRAFYDPVKVSLYLLVETIFPSN